MVTPDPQLRPRPVAHQGPSHGRGKRRHADGARRRPGRFHQRESQAGGLAMRTFIAAALIAFACGAFGQADPAVLAQARAHKEPLLDTLKDLVAIESNSRDFEGLERIANVIAERLKKLGGEVALVEPTDVYKMEDTPDRIGRMVRATFKGTGTK